MKFWKKMKYKLGEYQRLSGYSIIFDFMTGAGEVVGKETEEVKLKFNDSLDYTKNGLKSGWETEFRVIEEIEESIAKKVNSQAEELLKSSRKGKEILKLKRSVWVAGKHIVKVKWSVGDLIWENITFDEFLRFKK